MSVLCWFSAGAASAVATKLALNKYRKDEEVKVLYCDTGIEHKDNLRFLKDCEVWFGCKITILKNKKYKNCWEVWEKTRFLVSPQGARCTTEMKKRLRRQVENFGDVQIFGFTAEEKKRAERFSLNNPEVKIDNLLIENNLTKKDCFQLLRKAEIARPEIYDLGYKNANCIPCVKGGMGYWNKIRKDFPDDFHRMAKLERELGIAMLKEYENGERKRVFLDELESGRGRYEAEASLSCGVLCQPVFELV